jgi:hypothetical protein
VFAAWNHAMHADPIESGRPPPPSSSGRPAIEEAGVGEGPDCGADLGDEGDARAVEARLLQVVGAVVGGVLLTGQGLGELEHGREGLPRVGCEGRTLEQLLRPQPVEEEEVDVPGREDAHRHTR